MKFLSLYGTQKEELYMSFFMKLQWMKTFRLQKGNRNTVKVLHMCYIASPLESYHRGLSHYLLKSWHLPFLSSWRCQIYELIIFESDLFNDSIYLVLKTNLNVLSMKWFDSMLNNYCCDLSIVWVQKAWCIVYKYVSLFDTFIVLLCPFWSMKASVSCRARCFHTCFEPELDWANTACCLGGVYLCRSLFCLKCVSPAWPETERQYMQTCFTHSYIINFGSHYYTCLHICSILYVFKADMYGSCVSIWKPSSHWHYPNESNSDFKQTWICTQWCSTPTAICVVWKKTSWQNCNFLPEFMHFNLLLQPLSLLWEAFHEMLEHEWRDLFLIVASETAKPVN